MPEVVWWPDPDREAAEDVPEETEREGRDWLAAFVLGLIAATYSTVLISLGAGRIGRDIAVDWMQLATAYFGTELISAEPTWSAVLAGLFVHQSAVLVWALVFFGVLWSWTRRLSPVAILVVAVPWALMTSAVEYYLVLPRLQPIVPMQIPYWTALTVHMSWAAAYPLFPLVYGWLGGGGRKRSGFARYWGIVLGFAVAGVAVLFALGRSGSEVVLPGAEVRASEADGTFLRRMAAHHEIGLRLARIAAMRTVHPELRTLSELIMAEHIGELAIMRSWWASWVGGTIPPIGEDDYREMAWMPSQQLLDSLRAVADSVFDPLFLEVMIRHQEGVVAVSNETLGRPGDPRIDLMALSIRHSQAGQSERMRHMLRSWSGSGGGSVVEAGIRIREGRSSRTKP